MAAPKVGVGGGGEVKLNFKGNQLSPKIMIKYLHSTDARRRRRIVSPQAATVRKRC